VRHVRLLDGRRLLRRRLQPLPRRQPVPHRVLRASGSVTTRYRTANGKIGYYSPALRRPGELSLRVGETYVVRAKLTESFSPDRFRCGGKAVHLTPASPTTDSPLRVDSHPAALVTELTTAERGPRTPSDCRPRLILGWRRQGRDHLPERTEGAVHPVLTTPTTGTSPPARRHRVGRRAEGRILAGIPPRGDRTGRSPRSETVHGPDSTYRARGEGRLSGIAAGPRLRRRRRRFRRGPGR